MSSFLTVSCNAGEMRLSRKKGVLLEQAIMRLTVGRATLGPSVHATESKASQYTHTRPLGKKRYNAESMADGYFTLQRKPWICMLWQETPIVKVVQPCTRGSLGVS